MRWRALTLLAQAVRNTWRNWDCFVPILLSGCKHPLCALTVSQPKPQKQFFFLVFVRLPLEKLEPAITSVGPSCAVFPLLWFGVAGFRRAFLSRARPLFSSLELSSGSKL